MDHVCIHLLISHLFAHVRDNLRSDLCVSIYIMCAYYHVLVYPSIFPLSWLSYPFIFATNSERK